MIGNLFLFGLRRGLITIKIARPMWLLEISRRGRGLYFIQPNELVSALAKCMATSGVELGLRFDAGLEQPHERVRWASG